MVMRKELLLLIRAGHMLYRSPIALCGYELWGSYLFVISSGHRF